MLAQLVDRVGQVEYRIDVGREEAWKGNAAARLFNFFLGILPIEVSANPEIQTALLTVRLAIQVGNQLTPPARDSFKQGES